MQSFIHVSGAHLMFLLNSDLFSSVLMFSDHIFDVLMYVYGTFWSNVCITQVFSTNTTIYFTITTIQTYMYILNISNIGFRGKQIQYNKMFG